MAWMLVVLLWPAIGTAESLVCDWNDVDVVAHSGTPVTQASLTRPYMTARFGAGTLYVLRACDTDVGLIYLGAGELEVRDPGPERGHQLHAASADLPGVVLFEAAVIWSSDGAVDALLAQTPGRSDLGVPPGVRALLSARSDAARAGDAPVSLAPEEILWAPTPAQGGILAEFKTVGLKWAPRGSLEVTSPWLSYAWAPTGPLGDPREPGLWWRRGVGSALAMYLSGFPSEEDIAAGGTPYAQGRWSPSWDLVDVSVAVAASGPVGLKRVLEDIHAQADLVLRAGEDAGPWVPLSLSRGAARRDEQFAPITVQGVTAMVGGEPEAVQWARVGSLLWVRLPSPPEPGDVATLHVQWRGRVLDVQGQTGISGLAANWYPRSPVLDRHTITISVAVPSFWEVIATGHRIGEEDDGKVKIVTSRANHPVTHAVVVIADVRTEVIRPSAPGLPLIRLHRSPEHPAINAQVGEELVRHLEALVGLLGPYPWSELEIVEQGAGSSGSMDYPGIVALSGWDSPPAQVVTTRIHSDTVLGALVRQWLVHDLGPKGNHDAWLIEGLVTWARCLALDAADEGARCHGELAGARQSWMARTGATGGVLGSAQTQENLSGAVWLGPLAAAASANRMWRGPLILHSLRLLVGDEVVRAVLPRLMQGYGGQGLALSSFLVQIQAVSGIDLRAFMYGWVFNTPAQPEVRLDYRLVQEGAAWTLSGTGVIEDGRNTEPPLPLPTPILLSFKVGKETFVRRLVLSETASEIRIEGIPDKPRDVRLDPGKTFPGRVTVSRTDD